MYSFPEITTPQRSNRHQWSCMPFRDIFHTVGLFSVSLATYLLYTNRRITGSVPSLQNILKPFPYYLYVKSPFVWIHCVAAL